MLLTSFALACLSPLITPGDRPEALGAPADATVLFDGSNLDHWRHWIPTATSSEAPLEAARWRVEQRGLLSGPDGGDCLSAADYGDYHLHLELLPAAGPSGSGSRLLLDGRHELILSASPDGGPSIGVLAGEAPLVAPAAGQPREWQRVDVSYWRRPGQAPQATVWWNDVRIHQDVELCMTLNVVPGSEAQARPPRPADPWVVYEGKQGPGESKRIVFVTGDEEYRSEEGLPQLARILAERHGFTCTVLFSINRESGEIDPGTLDNIPGLEALAEADLMVLFTRFRDLPDGQMKLIVDYVESGRPIIGMRTATHAFYTKRYKTYERYSFRNQEWEGGFGRQVLGETWIDHHGRHGSQSTRGVIANGAEGHAILRGIGQGEIWDPSDVYTVRLPLPGDSQPLVLGEVLAGMDPKDVPLPARADAQSGELIDKNRPMMPVAWVKSFTGRSGKRARVFSTTLGSSQGIARPGTRRLLVNACYWAVGLEDQIAADLDVGLVGEYHPSPFGFGRHKQGLRPGDHQ